MRDRKKGIDTATQVFRKNLVQPEITGTDAKFSEFIPVEQAVMKPELAGY
jgi:hypothetical protein